MSMGKLRLKVVGACCSDLVEEFYIDEGHFAKVLRTCDLVVAVIGRTLFTTKAGLLLDRHS